MVRITNVADLTDTNDPQGRTYRQVNAAKQHAIPVGALVELETGERLRVMKHTRDCDQTPLYSIGVSSDEYSEYDETKWHNGYCEECLTAVNSNDASRGPVQDADEIEAEMKIENRRLHIKGKLDYWRQELLRLQANCSHENLVGEFFSDTGNYSPSDNSYWVEFPECGKKWNEDQSRVRWDRGSGSMVSAAGIRFTSPKK